MMTLTEIKKMLQKDFNVKYLSDLEQIELIQNNEDLHIGVVKVKLKVAYKYYTIGTFGVLNKNAKVDGRKVKASMTYINRIATWFADVQEVDVKIFIDDEYQTAKKVKQVELLTTQAIEKVACEVEPTIEEETQESTKKVNKMKKVVDYVKQCRFNITNIPQNTKGLEHLEFYLSEKNKVIVEKLGDYEVFLFNGKEMNRIICKNQEEIIKVVRKFAFSTEMPFNSTEQPTTKESCQLQETQTFIKEETNVIINLLKEHGATNIISNLKETHAILKFKMNNNNLTYRLFYLVNDEGGHEIGTDLFSTSQNLDVMNLSEFENRLTLEPYVIKKETKHKTSMDDLTGDINVCHELLKLENIACGVGVKWNDLFCTEKDLLRALYQIDLNCYKENGQYYMQGFHKQLHNGKMLSPKQITQLKRMARFICLHYLRDTFHKYNGKKLLKPKTK